MSVVSVVCCQVKVSVSSCSLVQRSLNECDVSECDCESLIMRRPWHNEGGGWAIILKNWPYIIM